MKKQKHHFGTNLYQVLQQQSARKIELVKRPSDVKGEVIFSHTDPYAKLEISTKEEHEKIIYELFRYLVNDLKLIGEFRKDYFVHDQFYGIIADIRRIGINASVYITDYDFIQAIADSANIKDFVRSVTAFAPRGTDAIGTYYTDGHGIQWSTSCITEAAKKIGAVKYIREIGLDPKNIAIFTTTDAFYIIDNKLEEIDDKTRIWVHHPDEVRPLPQKTKVKKLHRNQLLDEIIEDFMSKHIDEDREEVRELIYNYAKDENLRNELQQDGLVTEGMRSNTFYALRGYLLEHGDIVESLNESAKRYKERRVKRDISAKLKKEMGKTGHEHFKEWADEVYHKMEESGGLDSMSEVTDSFVSAKTHQPNVVVAGSVDALDEENNGIHINPNSPWAEAMQRAKEMGIGKQK